MSINTNMQDNNENVEFCDKIQLSEFVKIQPYGVLLTLDKNLHVLQCSENVETLLQTTVQELLNQPISHFIKTDDANEDVPAWLMQVNNEYKKMFWQSNVNKLPIFVYLHQDFNQIILEIERYLENNPHPLLDLTQFAISSMSNTTNFESITELAQTKCEEIKKITGFNRVIIYQFQTVDQSGIVLGEARDEDMESYLGSHFPPYDIPQSVREMYLKLPIRYIPDAYSDSVNIVPKMNPASNQSLDLSFVNLRMVAPIHTKYIQNMKNLSTTSIAIIQDNKLWGLIICHHKAVKFLSLELRLILQLLANSLSCKILALENLMYLKEEQKSSAAKTYLSTAFEKERSLLLSLKNYHEDILQLVCATGMSVYDSKSLHNYGNTPTNAQIQDLITWLKNKNLNKPYICAELPLEYEPSKTYKDKACGLLAIRIMNDDNQYLLFYKPEYIQTITWAGDPQEKLNLTQQPYSPRTSFARFTQQMTNKSLAWTNREIKSAKFISTTIIKQQLQDLLEAKIRDEKVTMVARLAAEYAHEINNPLSYVISNMQLFDKKINSFQQLVELCEQLKGNVNSDESDKLKIISNKIISFIQESNLSVKLLDLKNSIVESKEGLLQIKEIINGLKKLGIDRNENSQKIDINTCLNSAISLFKGETKSELILHQDFTDLPFFYGNDSEIRNVFISILVHMVESSEAKAEIFISTSVNDEDIVITFKDNCPDSKVLDLENVFKPFYNDKSISLVRELNMPLAYTIVKLHNGTISAKSEPSIGRIYTVCLPINISNTN